MKHPYCSEYIECRNCIEYINCRNYIECSNCSNCWPYQSIDFLDLENYVFFRLLISIAIGSCSSSSRCTCRKCERKMRVVPYGRHLSIQSWRRSIVPSSSCGIQYQLFLPRCTNGECRQTNRLRVALEFSCESHWFGPRFPRLDGVDDRSVEVCAHCSLPSTVIGYP